MLGFGREIPRFGNISGKISESITVVRSLASSCRAVCPPARHCSALGAPRLISKQILMRSHIVTLARRACLRLLRARNLVTCRYFPRESGTVLASMITRRLWFGLKRDRPSERVCSLSGGKVDELSSLHPFESKRVSETGFVSKRGLSE